MTDNLAFKLRNRFIRDIDVFISLLDRLQNGDQVDLLCLRATRDGTIEFRLVFEGRQLMLPNSDDILIATTFEDLVKQLDQIKIITGFGGLDEALMRAANGLITD